MLMLLLAYLHVLLFLRYLFQGKKFPVFFSIDSWQSFQEKKENFLSSLTSKEIKIIVSFPFFQRVVSLGELFREFCLPHYQSESSEM